MEMTELLDLQDSRATKVFKEFKASKVMSEIKVSKALSA
jgi:hypothetical protein